MRRTKDSRYKRCPYCGKKPIVDTYNMNIGWAFCRGYIFHRHKKIEVMALYYKPSELLGELAVRWNDAVKYDENGVLK